MKNILSILTLITALNSGTATAADSEFTLPFGLTTVPNAKLVISDVFDSPTGDREESVAKFSTKQSREFVIEFYRKSLAEAGFTIYSKSDTAKYYMIAAKRNDDRITVYYRNQSDWVSEDESEIALTAKYNKK
ncbi:hypothetical protein [uncultured Paraglaciecola sp.]|uniref:hypothetical protein n=1 Tax=uncultured Paraglaciecola sp. TaxID=1765024 RepID=UPI00262874AE|nr:hypothetical protein [uncultured Paraglaciecola sp.]